MKNKIILSLVLALCISGCNSTRGKVSGEANALTTAYKTKMDKGETTPDQDKRFITAINKTIYELDRSIRGTAKADSTRLRAQTIVNTGIDPNTPLDLTK